MRNKFICRFSYCAPLVLILLGGAATKTGAAPIDFSNPTSISIPDSGAATPYPSNISVSGLTGTVTDVNVTLFGLTHTFPDDIDILLVGPTGVKIRLMSDAGGVNDVSGVNLTFDDAALSSLPDSAQIVSGTFKPTNHPNAVGPAEDSFPAPAPGLPYGTLLSDFNGINPNGTWSLFVFDDAAGDEGTIAGGWRLTLDGVERAVPEPGSLTLLGMGLAGLGIIRRRRAKN